MRVGLVVLVIAMATVMTGPTAGADSGPWPLGTYVPLGGRVPDCPPRFQCSNFKVTACPNVQADASGELAQAWPSEGDPAGVVVFFSGTLGTTWWNFAPGIASDFMDRLREQDGLVVVQVRWVDPWLQSVDGVDTGPALLACRPATVVQWIHDTIYAPLGITPAPGQCGYCVTGNSGGASQASYPLSYYGLDSILDAVVPTGGPPHAAVAKGCLPGSPGYAYDPVESAHIDLSYGFQDSHGDRGPCITKDPGFEPRWDADSIDIGGNDYSHPTVRIEFIIGLEDNTSGPEHAADYRNILMADLTNDVTWTLVPDLGHTIQQYVAGLDALEAALLKSIVPGPTASILSGPPDPDSKTTATFTFISGDPSATFTCSLDHGPTVPCASPQTYVRLDHGIHTFSVWATDLGGVTGPPATWTWTIGH